MKVLDINVLVLAYFGDTIYEYYIRKHLIEKNIASVNELQKESIKYVSAVNQAKFLEKLTELSFFAEDEIAVIKRARNHKGTGKPKNCDIVTYKHATALEAVIGYLEITDKRPRIEKIMEIITGDDLC